MLTRAALTALAGWGAWLIAFPSDRPRPEAVRTTISGLRAAFSRHRGEAVSAAGAGLLGAIGTHLLFGAALVTVGAGAAAATVPGRLSRAHRGRQRAAASAAWPRLIEEIRVLTTATGRPIPTALFEAGSRGPRELRLAFAIAEREWLLTRDLPRSTAVLADLLDDAGADAVLQTLVVAHQLGGADLDRRLTDLAVHRTMEVEARRDADAELAGVRFARRLVLLVPLGMALAGQTIGPGRASYATSAGQAGVAISAAVVAGCWWWSGRLMRVLEPGRLVGR